jgi:hypothetical protein
MSKKMEIVCFCTCALEQQHEKLPSTMSLKKSIDMDPGFSFSGDIKNLVVGMKRATTH